MALNLGNRFISKNVYKYSQKFQCINSCWRNITSIDKDTKHNSLQNGTLSKLKEGPSLHHFINNPNLYKSSINNENKTENHPYIQDADVNGRGRKVFIKTYGCQMNFNDTEIVWSILQKNGFVLTDNMQESDVILLMTCAIREGAETKIWNKLEHLTAMKQKRENNPLKSPLKIGILGCMAERLKHKLIEKEKMVDLVAGPDSYRDLPRMLALTESGQSAINVLLSLDETYADVIPVQMNQNSRSAFVSIMRGCDNMCSYCIVPFTRGRERSRPIDSIVDEVKILSDKGIKEITLLGQNVNSYLDKSQESHVIGTLSKDEATHLSKGFKTVYRPKKGGLRFADLLDKVSLVNPEMRIRFTSPHPKDFPDEVLYLIRDRPNICNQVHLPAQSGNSRILDIMGRGYTRESYLELVDHIRTILPVVALNSDFICGFCSETEEEFQDTLSLIRAVKYNFAYVFSYSMREKTRAFHRFKDDVPLEVKLNRLERLSATFREEALFLNKQQIGSTQLILIEGESRRSQHYLSGRNDGNTKVIIPKEEVKTNSIENTKRRIEVGDYVVTKIMDATSQVLKGIPLYHSSIYEFAKQNHHQPTTKISCISNG